MVGTTADANLQTLFDTKSVSIAPFEKSQSGAFMRKMKRLFSTGVLNDVKKLQDIVRENLGDITFREAYAKTGRALNITVASTTRHEVPRLLNYLTAPHVLIWSAAAASCALKGLFAPVELMAKDSNGKISNYHPSGVKWSDGSVENDLPITRLGQLFNVNHCIVSQVNPHMVVLFSARPGGFASKMRYLIESEIKHRVTQVAELGMFPTLMKWLQPIITQPYEGDITIVPNIPLCDLTKIASNPTEAFRQRAIKRGMISTWPKIGHISNHCSIEIVLRDCKDAMKKLKRESSLQT
eukprot:TRINITY_DN4308_c0_g1_i1.p1 TRINITY_DN4308_c0_g1~~TRINITY_DN4308_c0_g1_i1.p1  ORF type:complete len:296 (-),score=55.82 TRINITY_DN4308_c0_g1_i1:75-962(-)